MNYSGYDFEKKLHQKILPAPDSKSLKGFHILKTGRSPVSKEDFQPTNQPEGLAQEEHCYTLSGCFDIRGRSFL